MSVQPVSAPCEGFRWVGQPFTSCDRCGLPLWEHSHEERLRAGAEPFSVGAMELTPITAEKAAACRRLWGAPVASAKGTPGEALGGITGDSWLDDLARASLGAADAKFSPVTAAMKAIIAVAYDFGHGKYVGGDAGKYATVAVEAAAPLIAAAERERLANIATELRAAFPADHPPGAMASFGDYIRTYGAPAVKETP